MNKFAWTSPDDIRVIKTAPKALPVMGGPPDNGAPNRAMINQMFPEIGDKALHRFELQDYRKIPRTMWVFQPLNITPKGIFSGMIYKTTKETSWFVDPKAAQSSTVLALKLGSYVEVRPTLNALLQPDSVFLKSGMFFRIMKATTTERGVHQIIARWEPTGDENAGSFDWPEKGAAD